MAIFKLNENIRCRLRGLDGWDESFVLGEDIDMSWRLIEHGGWIGYAENAWVSYRARSTAKGIFRQFYAYGKGDVDLFARYRARPSSRLSDASSGSKAFMSFSRQFAGSSVSARGAV